MSDTEYKRIFQLARDRALFGFAMLAQRIVKEADESLTGSSSEARSALDKNALLSARQILRRDGNVFLKRSDALFKNYFERAMRTMYTDLRPDLSKMAADDLSLIDDETVNHQIEVDRLVLRMRNADQANIGRLNVIIAQLHSAREARERENPFRPYLLARSLHEAVKDIATEDAVARVLFEHLSNSLIRHFSAYYSSILGAFESSGIRAQFKPQLSRLVLNQRYFGGLDAAPESLPEQFSARVLPGMFRMLELMQHMPVARDAGNTAPGDKAGTLQEFIGRIFSADSPMGLMGGREDAAANARSPASQALISELNQYQSLAARGEAVSDTVAPDQNQLFALREKIGADKATSMEQAVIDAVAMLFEFVLEDEAIPALLRGRLGRLQIPFLKAAMLEPGLLRDPEHPARQLLNRLCAVAVGCDSATPLGAAIAAEISQVVKNILDSFDSDTAIFLTGLEGFERFLVKQLRNADNDIAICADALEQAERSGMLLPVASALLADLMSPLQIDRRMADFITGIWARVLVKAFLQDATAAASVSATGTSYQRYRDLLAELVWSTQEKQSPQERSALMRLLPDLVKRLKRGLEFIRLAEDDARQALDQLVELHAQVMRVSQTKDAQELPSVAALRQRFALLKLEESGTSVHDHPHGKVYCTPLADIDAALVEKNVSATVCIDPEASPPSEEEGLFLYGLPLGACMAYRAGNEAGGLECRLVWISPRRSLYLFQSSHDFKPVVYAASSLLQELRDGNLRPVEYAPIFERAVGSLLMGAKSVHPGAG